MFGKQLLLIKLKPTWMVMNLWRFDFRPTFWPNATKNWRRRACSKWSGSTIDYQNLREKKLVGMRTLWKIIFVIHPSMMNDFLDVISG